MENSPLLSQRNPHRQWPVRQMRRSLRKYFPVGAAGMSRHAAFCNCIRKQSAKKYIYIIYSKKR